MMTQAEYYKSIYDGQISYAKDEGKIEVVREMLLVGEPVEKIARYTKLSLEVINRLKIELGRMASV